MEEKHEMDPGQQNVRIDAPHPADVSVAEASTGIDEVAEASIAVANVEEAQRPSGEKALAVAVVNEIGQVRTHATQLATHLGSMRDDLDRREAGLNAREAAADNAMRGARLWLQEREQELEARRDELDNRERHLAESMSRFAVKCENDEAKEATEKQRLGAKIRELTEQLQIQRRHQDSELHRRQQQLNLREQAVKALSQRLLNNVERQRAAAVEQCERRQQQLLAEQRKQFEDDYQRAARELEERQQYLDGAEALLVNSQADLEVQQQQLVIDRQRAEAEFRAARSQLAKRQRQMEQEWQERQKSLAHRDQQLESRQAALNQTRQEVAATHREALELRLATEELWAKLSEVMPPAKLTTELGKIRRKLAESYCLERKAALEQIQQLEESHRRLAEQYVKLTSEKADLHEWVKSRQQDIEQQAARLVAREQELDRQEMDMRRQSDEWERERRKFQAEIRRLITELRRGETLELTST
jgi:hypothetical protein